MANDPSGKKSRQNSLKNLKPFKPGQSGNPKGAAKGKRWKTVISEILELQAAMPTKGPDVKVFKLFEKILKRKLTNRDLIIIKQIFLAQEKTDAARLIMEREEGSTERGDKVVVNNFIDLSDEELDRRLSELMGKVNESPSED
jgi:hypothetical protein